MIGFVPAIGSRARTALVPMKTSLAFALMLFATPALALDAAKAPEGVRLALGAAEQDGPELQSFGGLRERDGLHRVEGLKLNLANSPFVSFGATSNWEPAGSLSVQPERGGALEVGGFLELGREAYRLDASLRGRADGGMAGDVGAAYRARIDLTGTDYSVRVGAGFDEPGAAISPVPSAFAPTESANRDLSLTLSLTHSFTPSLYVSGTASAERSLAEDDQDQNRFFFGGGLGFRF